MQKQIEQDPSAWIGGDRYALQALEQGAFAIEVLTKEEVFGQGILDVGKAVHGIARLDANRLAADNVVFVDELNEYGAIEAFDTKGFSAEFSNDISERRWDDDYHHSAYRTEGAFSNNAAALKDQKLGLLKAGSVFFAAGKDWAKTSEKAAALFGPIAWAEYAFAKRPEVKESGAGAAALHAQAETYDSPIVSAGLRAAVRADLDDQGSTASVELLTAWRHELLDDAYRTQACFAGYGAHPFSGQSYFQDRDALMVQTGVLLAVQNNFRLRLDVGGEFFRDDSSGVNFGLTLGWAY